MRLPVGCRDVDINLKDKPWASRGRPCKGKSTTGSPQTRPCAQPGGKMNISYSLSDILVLNLSTNLPPPHLTEGIGHSFKHELSESQMSINYYLQSDLHIAVAPPIY